MKTRTNEEWLMALKSDGEPQAAALSDLRAYLLRAARYTLHRSRNTLQQPAPTDIEQLAEDCAQDAVSAILGHLDQFRGESRFTTWAYKFAVNAALVAARRDRWGRVPLVRLLDGSPELAELIGATGDASSDPHRRALQAEILAAVRQGIEAHLTDRQRQALKAIVFEEVPLDELARHWASNRNALYKLLHDARRKLKAHLRDRGFGAKEIVDAFTNDR
jgi:RNA polymerase sigma-70 factor (ECF subfamily)